MESKYWLYQLVSWAIALVIFFWGMGGLAIWQAPVVWLLFLLLLLTRIPWLRASHRWLRNSCNGMAMLLVLVLVVISPLAIHLANQMLIYFLPGDQGEPVDAIVVLGRGEPLRKERVQVASHLWHIKRAPKIFVSGMGDAKPIVQMLQDLGVSPQRLSGENCSQTTFENALFTAILLQSQGVQKILLVTDDPHMERSFQLFHQFGFVVIPKPVAISPTIVPTEQVQILLRELVALGIYQFRQQSHLSSTQRQYLMQQAKQKIFTWKCIVQSQN